MSGSGSSGRRRKLGRGLTSLLADLTPVEVVAEADMEAGGATRSGAHTSDNNQVVHASLDGGSDTVSGAPPGPGIIQITISLIDPNPFQPRRTIDEAALAHLAESIRQDGVIQPVVVRPGRDGRYELVAGERRWRAAEIAGLTQIPAVVRDLADETAAQWAVIENLQREDLNPIERAWAFRSLAERFGMSHAEVAERVGLDRSTVANFIRLTELDEPIQFMIAEGAISAGHGKVLLSAPERARAGLAKRCQKGNWSVRRLERAIRDLAQSGPASKTTGDEKDERTAVIADLERQLGEHLSSRVQIRTDRSGSRGRLIVDFYDLDHFDALLRKLGFEMR